MRVVGFAGTFVLEQTPDRRKEDRLMARTTIQINFRLKLPVEDYQALCSSAAPAIAEVPGLQWKLFALDREDTAAAGIYLFSDRAAAEAYVEGPIVGGLRSHPGIADLSTRMMEVDESLSRITGPDR
jgi:hypothetical protein